MSRARLIPIVCALCREGIDSIDLDYLDPALEEVYGVCDGCRDELPPAPEQEDAQ